jgi:hypothetical protein
MTERIISLLLLAVAVAHLATDVLHPAFEASPRRSIDEPVPIPARSSAQEMPRPPPRDDPPGAAADGIYVARRRRTRHFTDCHWISASISHPGALSADITTRLDLNGGTKVDGEPSAIRTSA